LVDLTGLEIKAHALDIVEIGDARISGAGEGRGAERRTVGVPLARIALGL
jgi:hypothetical protein